MVLQRPVGDEIEHDRGGLRLRNAGELKLGKECPIDLGFVTVVQFSCSAHTAPKKQASGFQLFLSLLQASVPIIACDQAGGLHREG